MPSWVSAGRPGCDQYLLAPLDGDVTFSPDRGGVPTGIIAIVRYFACRALPLLLVLSCSGHGKLTTAQHVSGCQSSHSLTQSHVAGPAHGVRATGVFATCAWPPGLGAERDGYAAITLNTRPGPGAYEATDATEVDEVGGTCQSFRLTYQQDFMGDQHIRRLTGVLGMVTRQDATGKPYSRGLGFHASPKHLYYVHNASIMLVDATCGP